MTWTDWQLVTLEAACGDAGHFLAFLLPSVAVSGRDRGLIPVGSALAAGKNLLAADELLIQVFSVASEGVSVLWVCMVVPSPQWQRGCRAMPACPALSFWAAVPVAGGTLLWLL